MNADYKEEHEKTKSRQKTAQSYQIIAVAFSTFSLGFSLAIFLVRIISEF